MIAKQYTYLSGQISQLNAEINDATYAIKRKQETVEFFKAWAAQLKEQICRGCEGYGEIRVFYAQDDCKVETCKRCKGSGLKSN